MRTEEERRAQRARADAIVRALVQMKETIRPVRFSLAGMYGQDAPEVLALHEVFAALDKRIRDAEAE